jgi:hypothetical protein
MTDIVVEPGSTSIWLVINGEVGLYCDKADTLQERIRDGGSFGENTYFSGSAVSWQFRTTKPTEIYRVRFEPLLKIPVVYWKLLEVFEKCKNLSPLCSARSYNS